MEVGASDRADEEYEDLGLRGAAHQRGAQRADPRIDEEPVRDRSGAARSAASLRENGAVESRLAGEQRLVDPTILAELEQLRLENSELREQVAWLKEQIDSLAVLPEGHWLGQWKGPGALLQAPYDLFIVYSIKTAECTAYFGFSYVFVEYLSEEYGMSDEEAGLLYAAYGFLCTVIGLSCGFVIDRLGVRKSMLIGCTCSTLFRGICAVSRSKFSMWVCSVTLAPVGAAFGVPVLALAVRRYTHKENRTFAFSFFYSMLCLACLLGSMVVNIVRDLVSQEGMMLLGYHVSWMRMTAVVSTAFTAYTIVAASFCRDIQVLSDTPLKERQYCEFKPVRFHILNAIKEIVSQEKFWRLTGVTMVFVGVRMTFRHLDATFPKYFIRTYGPDAPFELILAINPIAEMIGTPLLTGVVMNTGMSLSEVLIWGSFFSGISVFGLAIWESYFGAVVFVLILSFGDALWSPKLYEFSTMAAAEGREGMYLAITMAPMYLASVPVGLLSGWLLGIFCPKGSTADQRDSKMMWFIIGLSAFFSPVLLYLLRKKLFRPEDEEQTASGAPEEAEEGEGEHRRPGKHRLPRSDTADAPQLRGDEPSKIGRTTRDDEAEDRPFRAP